MADEVRRVAPADWICAVRAARDEGFAWFDLLTCVDEIGREDALRVVVRLEFRAGFDTLVPRYSTSDTLVPRYSTSDTLVPHYSTSDTLVPRHPASDDHPGGTAAGSPHGVRIEVLLDRECPTLDTLGAVFAGATWREREVADFFGVSFTGGDDRPLLARPDAVGHPLRKDAVLAARVVTPWPGGREPGDTAAAGRRRAAAPGVPDPAVWGDRQGEPASPAEVAASVAGRRGRR